MKRLDLAASDSEGEVAWAKTPLDLGRDEDGEEWLKAVDLTLVDEDGEADEWLKAVDLTLAEDSDELACPKTLDLTLDVVGDAVAFDADGDGELRLKTSFDRASNSTTSGA